MTAAYLDPSSAFAHKALLAAGAAYAALKQPEQATIAYQKLLAQPGVAPDLAQRARGAFPPSARGSMGRVERCRLADRADSKRTSPTGLRDRAASEHGIRGP